MRRRISRRRDRGLAYANPTGKNAVSTALGVLGLAAAVGGGFGAIGGAIEKPPALLGGALGGASVGVGLTALGGFIWGLVSPEDRNPAFATAGIGLGAIVLVNVATSVGANVATAGK